jgi:hypothetical protein
MNDLARVATHRVLFGHQSVGTDILRGLATLAAASPTAGLQIVDASAAPSAGPVFAHAKVGRNGDPRGKTDAFATLLQAPVRFDVALHKYCYVDVRPETDVDALFVDYTKAMARLAAAHPRTRLVHVTIPLVRVPSGGVARLRALVSGPSAQERANRQREAFNARLRETFAREPLFDLAAVESSTPDGRDHRVPAPDGVRAMVPAYTNDGGHLNDAGAARAAAALVRVLASVLR